jgi:hypothetical protein
MTVSSMKTMNEKAGEFIKTSEAQEILKILSQHGMGIQLLHIHPSGDLPEGIEFDRNDFAPIPDGYIVVEENCQISFRPQAQVPKNSIPTAWAWNGVVAACVSSCVPHQSQGHVAHHQSQNP